MHWIKNQEVEIYLKTYDDPIFVQFNYLPSTPGRMYLSNGDPGYPPEPAEFDINAVFIGEKEITDYDYDEVYEALLEKESEIEERLYDGNV